MTPAEEEAYVRERWIHPVLACMRGAEFKVLPTMTKRSMIHADYLFTVQREAEIERRNAGIMFMEELLDMAVTVDEIQVANDILAREQAALVELKKGWK